MSRSSTTSLIVTLTLATSFALCGTAYGGPASYQCEIAEELELQPNGFIVKTVTNSNKGKRFAVDRRTGELLGPEGLLWSFDASKSQVVSRGNSDNSFAAVITAEAAKNGVHFTDIRVSEYVPGPKKPFIVVTGSLIYSGLCE